MDVGLLRWACMGPSPTANVREGEGISSCVSIRFSPRCVPSEGTESFELEALRSETSGLISGRDRFSILMELDERSRLNFKRLFDGHTFPELLIKEPGNVALSQEL
jgi:hypothetical protein